MRKKSPVVAKAIMVYTDGHKLIVEVHEDSGYSNFYRWYRQDGRKRKVHLRDSSRQLKYADNLDVVLARQLRAFGAQIVSHKITVLQKRKYALLLGTASSALPGGRLAKTQTMNASGQWVPNNPSNGSTRKVEERYRRQSSGVVWNWR